LKNINYLDGLITEQI